MKDSRRVLSMLTGDGSAAIAGPPIKPIAKMAAIGAGRSIHQQCRGWWPTDVDEAHRTANSEVISRAPQLLCWLYVSRRVRTTGQFSGVLSDWQSQRLCRPQADLE